MIIKPNIFEIATSELTQDAFITWISKWADASFKNEDLNLHETGRNFLLAILKNAQVTDVGNLIKVTAGRQWQNIDIWIDIDEKYFIIIEDKKDSCEHGDQLDKYKSIVEQHYNKSREIIPVYLKTGNESLSTIKNINERGWFNFDRGDFLKVLRASGSNNDILLDFRAYLENIETETHLFHEFDKLNNWKASEGLYLWLQSQIEDSSDWKYVPNQNGGFLGFWYHFRPCANNSKQEIYLQIENYVGDKINLFIRIGGHWEKTTKYLYKVLELIEKECNGKGIEVSKPSRFKSGEYSSVALVKNAFRSDANGKLDLPHLLKIMKYAEAIVTKVASQI